MSWIDSIMDMWKQAAKDGNLIWGKLPDDDDDSNISRQDGKRKRGGGSDSEPYSIYDSHDTPYWVERTASRYGIDEDQVKYLPEWDDWKEGYFENVYKNRMEQTGIQQDQIQNQLKSARERFGIETTNMFKTGDIQGTQQRQQAQMGMGKQGFQGSGFNQQQLDDSLKNLQDGLNTNLKNLRLGFRDQRSALNTQYSMLTSQSSMYVVERDKDIRENKDSWEQTFFDRISNINMWSNK